MIELELATIADISNELGNREYGHFVFYDGTSYTVGKSLTRKDVAEVAKHLMVIAKHVTLVRMSHDE